MLIKDKYEFLPTSVIKLAQRQRQKLRANNKRTGNNKTKDEYAYNSSRAKFGEFDEALLRYLYQYYNRSALVTIDPFAGWGNRGKVADELGIAYFGTDISPNAIAYAKATYEQYNYLANAKSLPFATDSFGFSITSPPYWNIEKYESTNGQLSDIKQYDSFLEALNLSILESIRVLQTDALVVWLLADFRRKGHYYDFSGDCVNLFKAAGAKVFDKIIIDKSARYRIPLFMPQAERLGYTVKVHEYAIVFKVCK